MTKKFKINPDQIAAFGKDQKAKLAKLVSKAIKTGVVKCDLYDPEWENDFKMPKSKFSTFTLKQVENAVKKMMDSLTIIHKKGTVFYCHLNSGGQEVWSSSLNDGYPAEWAEKFLENIQKKLNNE